MATGEDARLGLDRSVRRVALAGGLRPIGGGGVLSAGRREPIDERMLGREDHVGRAEEGIRTGRVDADHIPAGVSDRCEARRSHVAWVPIIDEEIGPRLPRCDRPSCAASP